MTPAQQELFDAALAARQRARAVQPLPGGRGGRAAARQGVRRRNVENAAYPQGWCAEASAIAAMVTAASARSWKCSPSATAS